MHEALLLVGGVVVVLLALRLVALTLGRRTVENLDFRGPVRAVEVDLDAGEITLRGSGRADARVRRTMRRGRRRPRLRALVDDGVHRLRASGIVQYEVDVPAGAAVTVRGESASATVIGLSGTVDLRAGGGSLEGRALGTPALRASTAGGSIRMSFDRQPKDVDVATDVGAVELTLPDGPYDIDVASAVGQARVGVPSATGARCRVRARSSAGPVRIRNR